MLAVMVLFGFVVMGGSPFLVPVFGRVFDGPLMVREHRSCCLLV